MKEESQSASGGHSQHGSEKLKKKNAPQNSRYIKKKKQQSSKTVHKNE